MFSMCSELTPRARIPDTRIPQYMQPCQGLSTSRTTRNTNYTFPFMINNGLFGQILPFSAPPQPCSRTLFGSHPDSSARHTQPGDQSQARAQLCLVPLMIDTECKWSRQRAIAEQKDHEVGRLTRIMLQMVNGGWGGGAPGIQQHSSLCRGSRNCPS